MDSAIVGIRADDGGTRLITIPKGSTLVLIGKIDRHGLVDVSYDGTSVAVFARDLTDRSTELPADAARR